MRGGVVLESNIQTGVTSGFDLCVETKAASKISADELAETLAYIFETLLPKHGYNYRAEQAGLAAHILEALYHRTVSLSEASVGIGKTHAYLIAAVLIKRGRVNDFWISGRYPSMGLTTAMPVVVATSSIALQKAVAKDYIPEISRILIRHGIISQPLSSVIRKGKEHYVCDRRLRAFSRQDADAKEKQLLEPLINGTSGIDLGEMDFLSPYVKRRINAANCGSNCGWHGSCRYTRFLKDAQSDKYDFQVCNHNYLLADVLRRVKSQCSLIPNYQAIVIDEAHKFPQIVRQMYGMELSSLTLPRIAKTVRSFVFQPGQSTVELCRDANKLDGQAKRLFRVLDENIPDSVHNDEAERFKTEIDSRAQRHLRNVREIIDRITEGLEARQVLQKYKNLCSHTLWELANVREQVSTFEKHRNLVYWLEKPEGIYSLNTDGSDETRLYAIPKRLGKLLHTDLWSKGIPVVLTSGTLSASGDFTHIKPGLGLDRLSESMLMETSSPSSFNYKENTLLYISENVPFPDTHNARYIEAVTDEMERLIMAAHGHTAALFTSYRMMELVFDALKTRSLPFSLFRLRRGGMNAIERFSKSGNGILFAAGSMWEGIDLPGDILSLLVIVKLPFAVPDPVSEYERTQYGSMDKYKNAVVVPEMLVKLKQGFGRLIRSETDTGVVALLDSRVREDGAYRDRVLKALPDCRVTSSVEAIKSFILSKKTSDYFL